MRYQLLNNDLTGDVLMPGDDGYAESATAMFGSGTPALVVRPRDSADVAIALRHARREGLTLSVRSGGHGPLGTATNDGGMVLDLAHLDAVELIDRSRRIVRVGGGATWGQVASVLAPHGLGISAGDTAGVGVGGLTLGGGVGWLVRKHGLAVDQLVAAHVVTADGRMLTASQDQYSDLFWAIRGGGGNFGVVVSFDFAAQPVDRVRFGTITYQPDDPQRIVSGWRDHMRTAGDDLTSTLGLVPGMFGRPPMVMVLACYAGPEDGAAAALDPLLRLGTVTSNSIESRPYADILEDAQHPHGVRLVGRNTLVPRVGDEVIADVVAAYRSGIATMLRSLGGAFGRVPAAATAFAHRDAEAMVVGAAFLPQEASDADVEAALGPWGDVARHGTGLYVNFQGSATIEDLALAYPAATYARLVDAKRRYDPENVFDRNHNIAPAGRDPLEGPAA